MSCFRRVDDHLAIEQADERVAADRRTGDGLAEHERLADARCRGAPPPPPRPRSATDRRHLRRPRPRPVRPLRARRFFWRISVVYSSSAAFSALNGSGELA